MIEICNLRKEQLKFAYDMRVDRNSILGNPFYMRDESERDIVCEKYKEYFYREIKNNKVFLEELRHLYRVHKQYGRLRLFCWCAPKKCHAETIKAFLESHIKK